MGGTSFEVTLVTDGEIPMTRDAEVDEIALGLPAADSHSIGAGGGSIAWVDSGGMLCVGPRSAGAMPGPACYGHGGTEPTVSDANLILGYYNPDNFVGGEMKLDVEAARKAMATVAEPLGLSIEEAAAAVYRIVNTNMVGAMKAVSVMRGIHPRGYTMVVGGGAAGAHAGKMAEELEITKILFPVEAGQVCAYGMVVADLVHWDVTAYPTRSDKLDLDDVQKVFDEMEAHAFEQFTEQGIDAADVEIARFADVKYSFQVHELLVPVLGGEVTPKTVEELTREFEEQHRRLYSYAMPGMPLDIVALRLRATVAQVSSGERTITATVGDKAEPVSTRQVIFDPKDGPQEARIYDGEAVAAEVVIPGPAVIELPTTSLAVWPTHTVVRRTTGEWVMSIPRPEV